MNRGGSSGGGQSSLGYLFGGGETPKPVPKATTQAVPCETQIPAAKPEPVAVSAPVDATKQVPAGIHSQPSNNYFRADGQNTGNFITERPSTKVHHAPGGGSSLGYMFGNGGSKWCKSWYEF